MDLRQHTLSDSPEAEIPGAKPGEPPRRYVKQDAKRPDPDVQAMVDESAARFVDFNARLGLYSWGLQVFRRENGKHDDPSGLQNWTRLGRWTAKRTIATARTTVPAGRLYQGPLERDVR